MARSALNLIKQRRSIRRFKPIRVKQPQLNQILEAGRWAPSGLNNQPWRFLIIKDDSRKKILSTCTCYHAVINSASACILVFLDKNAIYSRDKDLMAMGACIQNMLLMAESIHIGSCWLGEILNQKQRVMRLFKLSKNLELAGAIALGYKQNLKTKKHRKDIKKLIL